MTAIGGVAPRPLWANSHAFVGVLAVGLAALVVAFWPGIAELIQTWETVEEYSYGWFIPPLVAFLIWQKTDQLSQAERRGSTEGFWLLGLAALMCLAGRLSLVRLFLQYGFIVGIFGLALCASGRSGIKLLGASLAALVLMVPLPHFVLHDISERLQLLSSSLGVDLIRTCQISVYLEGNLIDLGSYKLQVVDACSGLRYLFPLIAVGFLVAYFFKAPIWKRAVLLISTIPLTILINSARIGLIGVTVEYWGSAMAEGLLHEFEGWFMFMLCLVLLVAEMALLARLRPQKATLREAFVVEFPAKRPPGAEVTLRDPSSTLKIAVAACVLFAAAVALTPARPEIEPARQPFTDFPMTLNGGWVGRPGQLDSDTIATLELDDYVLVDYTDAQRRLVNFYVAYYASQTGAEKASHSPSTCIPGGGWSMSDLQVVNVALADGSSQPANRVIITRGDQKEMVYYWFKQRDREVTGDWLVKWYIVRDSILTGRTDGALVRLVSPIAGGESAEAVDHRLEGFIRTIDPKLTSYVPN